MLSIPIFDNGVIRYLSFPVGYRMWTKEKTKLAMAADMVKEVMDKAKDIDPKDIDPKDIKGTIEKIVKD